MLCGCGYVYVYVSVGAHGGQRTRLIPGDWRYSQL